jgi:hypothetical protein
VTVLEPVRELHQALMVDGNLEDIDQYALRLELAMQYGVPPE